MRLTQSHVVIVLLYVAMTSVMTLPFVNWEALASSIYPGDARLMAWTIAWNNHAWLQGLPQFDANIHYPAPAALAYTDPMFGVALFGLPIYAATSNAVLTYNVLFVSVFLLNALAMHLLSYRVTGDHVASMFSGVAFAFSFYMMLHAHGHLSLIWTWPMPLSFVLLDRWVAHPTVGRACAWGGAVVLQVLASWYLAVVMLLATALMVVWQHATIVRDRWGARIWQLGLVASLAAVVVWPLAEPYRTSLGTPEESELRAFSADWASYFVPPLNTLAGQWWASTIDSRPRWIWGEQTLFIGWIAIVLALAGGVATALRLHRAALVYCLMVAAGIALSFGPAAPRGDWPSAFDALRVLPGVEGFRAPARFGLLVLLGVSVLIGCGTAELRRRMGPKYAPGLLVLIPLMLAEWFVVDFPLGRPLPVAIPEIYSHPAVLSANAIVSIPDYRHTDRWPQGGDYLLYATHHWRPIANGYGRAQPDDHASVISHMTAFPGPNNARTMRRLGINVLIFHGARYGAGFERVVATALETGEYDLVATIDRDYLFRVKPDRAPAQGR